MNTVQDALRYYLAALKFRFEHVTGGAPEGFGDFQAGGEVRTPCEIVRHTTGLLLFVHHRFVPFDLERLPPLPWEEERSRFLDVLGLVDDDISKGRPLRLTELGLDKLFQGPFTDIATHIGQLATLRRLAGAPVDRVSYLSADMQPEPPL